MSLHTYMHYITYITFHYITLRYITFHYITLHMYIYIYIYIYTYHIIMKHLPASVCTILVFAQVKSCFDVFHLIVSFSCGLRRRSSSPHSKRVASMWDRKEREEPLPFTNVHQKNRFKENTRMSEENEPLNTRSSATPAIGDDVHRCQTPLRTPLPKQIVSNEDLPGYHLPLRTESWRVIPMMRWRH